VLVKYKESKIDLDTPSGQTAASDLAGGKFLARNGDLAEENSEVLKIKDSKSVEEKVAELKKDPNIELAQPNYRYHPLSIDSNDPYKDYLWAIENFGQNVGGISGIDGADIKANEAWKISEGQNGEAVVAVIDTGVAYNHPDLAASMWDGTGCADENGNALGGCSHGYDFEDNDRTPIPTGSFHGTHIAGIIAAAKNNAKGITGVAPRAKIMALKTSFTTAEIVKAIHFAKQNNAKIINASWGDDFQNGAYTHDCLDQFLYDAIADFPGIFVVAAGNQAQNHDSGDFGSMIYPAGFRVDSSAGPGLKNVIVVAATGQDDSLASFSDYGNLSVDVAAPGKNIFSTIAGSASTTPFSEDFQTANPPNLPGGWEAGGNMGIYDIASSTDFVLFGDLRQNPYDGDSNYFASSPVIDLNGAAGAKIDFWAACDTEYRTDRWTDYMALEISSDGATFQEFNLIPSFGSKFDEPTLDILNSESPPDPAGSAAYHFKDAILPAGFLTSNFRFRFRWVSDGQDNDYGGCYIDNIKIIKEFFSDGSDEQYGFMQGTSTAAPQAAGLAALIWGYKPGLDADKVKDLILETGDSLPPLDGKIVTGKRINALSALESLAPPVISNIQIASTTADSAIVAWLTDKPAKSKVAYATSTIDFDNSVFDGQLTVSHNSLLANLSASTTYYFFVESVDEYGDIATSSIQAFTTLPPPDIVISPSLPASPYNGGGRPAQSPDREREGSGGSGSGDDKTRGENIADGASGNNKSKAIDSADQPLLKPEFIAAEKPAAVILGEKIKKDPYKESAAKKIFKKIYKRNPKPGDLSDDAAVLIIAYGPKPGKRNLGSEASSIKTFMAVYGRQPKSSFDWDIIHAIAYSGSKR